MGENKTNKLLEDIEEVELKQQEEVKELGKDGEVVMTEEE